MEIEDARSNLRVGNIVSYMVEDKMWPVVVKSIHQGANFANVGRIENMKAEYQAHFFGLIPLPITEKRLEKLNFFSYSGKWVNNGCSIDENLVAEINKVTRKLTYIHELQNFFEDNRGERLPMPWFGK